MEGNTNIIVELFAKVENKNEFLTLISNEFKVKPQSARINWFIKGYLPEQYGIDKRIIKFTQNYIANQSKTAVE